MRYLISAVVGLVALAGSCHAGEPGAAIASGDAAAARSALTAMLSAAPDIPQGKGYLAVARDQADTVQRRLDAAAAPDQDKASVVRRVGEALHALDPNYGVAVSGAADYGLRQALVKAEASAKASAPLLKGDARLEQVVAALEAAQSRVDEAVDFGRAVMVSPSEDVARQGVRAMGIALQRAVDGWDRDGTHVIDWRRGEAGLNQAEAAAKGLAEPVPSH